jgi:predicted metalloprotease with PDZ domain
VADPIVWQYEVGSSSGGVDELAVDARFAPVAEGSFGVDDDAAPYVRGLAYLPSAPGAAWVPIEGSGSSWRVPCANGCRMRYRYALREAAASLKEPQTAIASSEVLVAPPATWLLRPEAAGGRFRFHVAIEPPWRFATGVHPSPGGPPDTFEGATSDLEDSSFAAFGAFDDATIQSGGVRAEAAIARDLTLSSDDVTRWVKAAVDGLVAYYEHPFVDRVLVIVMPGQAGSSTRGETLGDGGAAVLVRAAGAMTAAATRDDWVMTHELIHVSLPSLSREHAWLSEGIATYVEPMVRARAGLVTPERYWHDLVEGLPQGLPEAGDEGLERTHTWGRTYWGGALFCFVADLTIRERTGNARSLDDVLRGIVASGAHVESHWAIDRFLEAGDRAAGNKVLEELYRDMGLAPGSVDLAGLWQRLGVRIGSGRVTFDDSAPLAAVRRSITQAATGAASH